MCWRNIWMVPKKVQFLIFRLYNWILENTPKIYYKEGNVLLLRKLQINDIFHLRPLIWSLQEPAAIFIEQNYFETPIIMAFQSHHICCLSSQHQIEILSVLLQSYMCNGNLWYISASVNAFLNFCPRDNFGMALSIKDMGDGSKFDQKLWIHHT